jgi:hypothetical protein
MPGDLLAYIPRNPDFGKAMTEFERAQKLEQRSDTSRSETKRISLPRLRKVLGLESVKETDGNIIREAPLPVWANLRQRELDTAIREINEKTDLNVRLESLGRSRHRR